MSYDPSTIALCGKSKDETPLGEGYTSCVGTAGASQSQTEDVSNNEPSEYQKYVQLFDQTDSPCVSEAFQQSTANQHNYVGTQTANGCCIRPSSDPSAVVTLETNKSHNTRLTAFTTGSKIGAQDADNILKSIPDDLLGFEKQWGIIPKNWHHGGVRAGNVGLIKTKDKKGFEVKYNGKTWSQKAMLWVRMTGDNLTQDQVNDETLNLPIGLKPTKTKSIFNNDCGYCTEKIAEGSSPTCNREPPTEDSEKGSYNGVFAQQCWTGSQSGVPIPVVDETYLKDTKSTNPITKENNMYTNPFSRVGGCFVTRDQYGPGSYRVLARIPKEAGTKAEGSHGGVVWAMWTFSYLEAYENSNNNQTKANPSQMAYPPNPTPLPQSVEYPKYKQDEAYQITKNNPPRTLNNLQNGDVNDGYFSVHNHEIDIEWPANSAQLQGEDMKIHMGDDTMNCNTWIGDTSDYSPTSKALYTQAMVRKKDGSFISNDGEFHEYRFDWRQPDPKADSGNGYVDFYFDEELVFRSKRFVPTRSGRFVFGLWPAWWGSNYKKMNYDIVTVDIARVEIIPAVPTYNSSFPTGANDYFISTVQTYDQDLPKPLKPIVCGFSGVTNREPRNVGGNGGSGGSNWVLWVTLSVVVAVTLAVTLSLIYGPK